MKRLTTKRVVYIVCIIAAIFAAATKTSEPQNTDGLFSVTFIDVGQGDSALLTAPNGKTLLIDGGEYDAYEESLKPYLLSQGISQIDFALASHYHSDHMGGISELIADGKAKNLIIPEYDDKNKTRERLLKKAEKSAVNVSEISAGDTIDLGDPQLKITALHPEKGGFSLDNENSNSLVLFVEYADTTFLFTGDLEEDAEKILSASLDLECDVLKVGHHGSQTSSSQRFLNNADPTYAVISVGNGNSYGHPHYEVLERLENDDVRIYRTDTDGSVTFKVSEKGIEKIETEKGA